METFDCIESRRSIRKYSPKTLEFEKVARIIEAGSKAPSAGNLQAYRFILVTDRDKIDALPDMCSDQYWISEAQAVIVVCEDIERIEAHYGLRGQRLYAIQDCAAAVQNMLLAANDFGLGACWIGSFEEDYVADLFGVPTTARVQAIITLGYPGEEPGPKTEEPLDILVYFNKYGERVKNMNVVTKEYSKEISKTFRRLDNKTEKGIQSLKVRARNFLNNARENMNKTKNRKL